MTRYQLRTFGTGNPTRIDGCCEITREQDFGSSKAAYSAARAMLSVLDFVYGTSTHSIEVYRKATANEPRDEHGFAKLPCDVAES